AAFWRRTQRRLSAWQSPRHRELLPSCLPKPILSLPAPLCGARSPEHARCVTECLGVTSRPRGCGSRRSFKLANLFNHDADRCKASHQLVIHLTSPMGRIPVRSEVAEVSQITRLITKDSSGVVVRR